MTQVPAFVGGVPIWSLRRGVWVPVFVDTSDPNGCDDCCTHEGEPPPVLFDFCDCQVRSVDFTVSGYVNDRLWLVQREGGGICLNVGDWRTVEPTLGCQEFLPVRGCMMTVDGSNSGFPVIIVHETDCTMAALNGTYNTTDVVLLPGNKFVATFHLGKYHDLSDPGVLVCYHKAAGWGCSGLSPCSAPEHFDVREDWIYIYEITLTALCSGCVGTDGRQITYVWSAGAQVYTRYRNFVRGCEVEGWAVGDPGDLGCQRGPYTTGLCYGGGTCLLLSETGGNGASGCFPTGCPTPSSGITNLWSCVKNTAVPRIQISHQMRIL